MFARRSRIAGVVVLCLVGVVAFPGCGDSGQDVVAPNPYAAQFEEAVRSTSSDYVRGILSDRKIDTFELHDAQQHVVACLHDAGLNAWYEVNEWGIGSLTVEGATTSAQIVALNRCQDQWMGAVDQIYWSVFTNPGNEDWDDLVATCLVRKRMAPAGFTGQDYADLIKQNSIHVDTSTMAPDENGVISITSTEPGFDGRIPGGGSLSDPEVLACTVMPLG